MTILSLKDPVAAHVSARMRAQRRRDTQPELALRRELHRRGLRFRLDTCPIPGARWRADIVFGPARTAVFIDGCFWHACPQHANVPLNNREWWSTKLATNRERDGRVRQDLESCGWSCLRIWEHEDVMSAADLVEKTVTARRAR